jgi:membrane fusion protein (multidrug efflux system)
MKNFRFVLLTALFVLLIIIFGTKMLQFKAMSASADAMTPPPVSVSTFIVEEQTWSKSINVIGSINPTQGVLLQAEVEGVVRDINFENGKEVQAGDLLVQLDISVENAELRAAKALASLAILELKRAKRLNKSGNTSQSDLDRAVAEAQRREAEVENIEARIARKTIRAPFAGEVGIRQINLGQYVPSGAALVSLQSYETVYANFSLPQNTLSKIKNGYAIELTTDAYPGETFEGTLTAISPEIDPATRSISVQATFNNSDGLLRAGLFVRAEVLLPEISNVIVVPSTSVLYAPYGNSVYKVEESESGPVARQYFIKTGEHRGDFVTILDGARAGDIIVSAGAFKLRNGVSVKINNELAPKPELEPKANNS